MSRAAPCRRRASQTSTVLGSVGTVFRVGQARDGSVIWLWGGPRTGKSSIARAIQRLGALDGAWLHAGDEHLRRQLPPGLIVTTDPTADPASSRQGWLIPFATASSWADHKRARWRCGSSTACTAP